MNNVTVLDSFGGTHTFEGSEYTFSANDTGLYIYFNEKEWAFFPQYKWVKREFKDAA